MLHKDFLFPFSLTVFSLLFIIFYYFIFYFSFTNLKFQWGTPLLEHTESYSASQHIIYVIY